MAGVLPNLSEAWALDWDSRKRAGRRGRFPVAYQVDQRSVEVRAVVRSLSKRHLRMVKYKEVYRKDEQTVREIYTGTERFHFSLRDCISQKVYYKERTGHKPRPDSTVASPYTTPIFIKTIGVTSRQGGQTNPA